MGFFVALPLRGASAGSLKRIDNPSVSDADLVRSVLSGDEESFTLLLDRHVAGVYSFVYRYLGNADDANDITQETFVRSWKHIKKFDTSRNFKTWIFAIARNASLDFIKKKKSVLFSKIEEGEQSLDAFLAPYVESPDLPSEVLARNDAKQQLEAALAKIPAGYRMVLSLRYREGLKFREIAEVLAEPIDTVKSKHRRGLALLRAAFGER